MNKFWKTLLEVVLDRKIPENVAEEVPIESSATFVSLPKQDSKTLSNAIKTEVKRMKVHEMLQKVQSHSGKPGTITVIVKEVAPGVMEYEISVVEAPQV